MSATFFTLAPVEKDNGLRLDSHWIWCPSILRAEDGAWHMFASRWPKSIPFHPGWLTNSEVIRAVADRPEGPYKFAEVVLPARGAEFWDGCATHNPTVRAYGGKYYLFYTGITYPFHRPGAGETLSVNDPSVIAARASKRIGLAVAEKLTGPWQRAEAPLLRTKPGTYYSFLTSNAAPLIQPDGSVVMIFKSRRYEGYKHGVMYLGVARAPAPEGPYEISAGPLSAPELEDPFLWQEEGRFYLLAKDMHARLTPEEGALMVIPSPDGTHFDPANAILACPPKQLALVDGVILKCAHMERPFLVMQEGCPTHFCVAVSDGRYGFENVSSTWNAVIPLARQTQY